MRTPFFQRLATRLFTLPLLLFSLALLVAGIGVYSLSPLHMVGETHLLRLRSLSSEKKTLFDAWLEQTTRSVDILSRSDRLRAAAAASAGLSRHKPGPAAQAGEELIPPVAFKVVALLSKEGRVLASSPRELEGGEWADREFFERATADLTTAAAVGLYHFGSSDSGLVFLAPVTAPGGETTAFLYCLVGTERVARLLGTEHPFYRTEKTELLDREGNVLLTRSGVPDRKIRYNLPRTGRDDGRVRAGDRYYYTVQALDHAPFRLISTVERTEALLPALILFGLFGASVLGLLLLAAIQGLAAAPRRITRPVARLIGMAKLVGAGSFDIEPGTGYRGELLELKKAFAAMLEELKELKAKETTPRASGPAREAPVGPLRSSGVLSPEVRAALERMVDEAEQLLASEGGLSAGGRRMLTDLRDTGADLLWLIDSLLDSLALEAGRSALTPETFSLCGLLAEVEERTRRLIGKKEITLIVDCQETLTGTTASLDRGRLGRILLLLARTAVQSTEVGTITLLASAGVRDGVSFLEVSVADTGRGIEREVLERLPDEDALALLPLGINVAKKMTGLLGGTVEIESEPEKGSAVTVTVPLRAIIF